MKDENYSVDDQDILERIQKNVDVWYDYFSDNNNSYLEDVKFVHGDQWTLKEIKEYDRLEKPVFTVNKLYPYVKHVLGEARKVTPGLEIRDTSGKAKKEELDLQASILRDISYNSKSNLVLQKAFECALKGGYGAFRIITDYESSNSFKQIIKYDMFEDPRTTFFDRGAKDSTKSDGNYCGCWSAIDKKVLQQQYPDVDFDVMKNNDTLNFYGHFAWHPKEDSIIVADYYEKEYFKKKILLLSTGDSVDADKLSEFKKEKKKEANAQGIYLPPVKVVDEREADDYTIYHYTVCGNKILDKKEEWPSKYLPMIFVEGDSVYLEGQQTTISFIRYVKDVQKFLNYLKSDIAHGVLLMRREQYIGTIENIPEKYRKDWANPSKVLGMLYAKRDMAGQLPIKQPPSELSQSELQQYDRTEMDIQSGLGMFEANRGQNDNAQSGVALANKIRQGNLPNYIYHDNLLKAAEQAGRVNLDLIPKIYDTDRFVSTRTKTNQPAQARINYKEDGEMKNQIQAREFDIEVTSGTPFEMQKEETFAKLMQIVTALPGSGQLIADILAQNIDIQNGQQLVERMQTLVPAQIIAKEEGKPPPSQKPDPKDMAEMQKIQSDMKDAQAKMITAQANMMKAMTDAQNSKHATATTAMKTQAEREKTVMDYKSQTMKLAQDHEKLALQKENAALKNMSGISGY